jgi:hypothetical protein
MQRPRGCGCKLVQCALLGQNSCLWISKSLKGIPDCKLQDTIESSNQGICHRKAQHKSLHGGDLAQPISVLLWSRDEALGTV